MLQAIEQYLSKTVFLIARFVMIILLVRFFLISPGRVDGQSMEPTFKDDQFFLVNVAESLFRPLQRFDVVQIFIPGTENIALIKRVIGLSGETVMIKRNAVFVRDVTSKEFEIEEPYLYESVLIQVPYGLPNTFYIPENSYFVLGDNRAHSGDSREFGPVHRSNIIGKVRHF